MHGHVGVCSDNLLLGRQLGALLEFEITNGPRQGQVAIDTAKVNEAASGADTSFLAYSHFYQKMES